MFFSYLILIKKFCFKSVSRYLSDLHGDRRSPVHVELLLHEMQYVIKRHPLAEAGHYGEPRRVHAGAHEQDQVLVTRLPERRQLYPELVERFLVVVVHFKHL